MGGILDGVRTDIGPSYSEAMQLLDRYEQPDHRVPARLYDLAGELRRDGNDLLWRVEFLESTDGGAFDALGRRDGTGAQRQIEAIAAAFNISEQVAAELIEELSFEGAMEVAEHKALLEDLAEQAEGLFDVNPFTLTAEEIDDRIAELSTAGPPRHQVELAILHALKDEFDASDSDLPFLLDPSALAERNTDDNTLGADHIAALLATFGEDDPLLADMGAIFGALSDSQTSITSNQIDSYINAEHDYADPESIGTIIAMTRAIFGADEHGNPTYTPEQLGISEDTYGTGLQVNFIAESVELEIYAAQHSPAEYLTPEELQAIALLEQHFPALMAIGAVSDNSSTIPGILGDGEQSYGLTWTQLEAIANGDHISLPIIPGFAGTEDQYLADLLEYFDGVPGLTPDSLEELQVVAQMIIANPRAFEALVGANSGTEIIQGEELTGDLRGGVVVEDFDGFQNQERLRQLIGQFAPDIDSITNGEIDGDISAEDFATFIVQQPDLPAELVDLLNQAIDSGLTDAGGWERIQSAFETAGIVIGGLTLLAIPGGNVIVLSGLTVAGVVVGAGELYAAAQTGDDEAFAWALVGTVLDFIDVAEIATIGVGFAAANAARRQGDEATAIALEQLARNNPEALESVEAAVREAVPGSANPMTLADVRDLINQKLDELALSIVPQPGLAPAWAGDIHAASRWDGPPVRSQWINGGPLPKPVPEGIARQRIAAALRDWKPAEIIVGPKRIRITRERMEHFLKRHSPDHWHTGATTDQSFFPNNWGPKEIESAIREAVRKNRTPISEAASGDAIRLTGTINGRPYVLTIQRDRVVQFFLE